MPFLMPERTLRSAPQMALLEWSDAAWDLVTVSIHTYERAPQLVSVAIRPRVSHVIETDPSLLHPHTPTGSRPTTPLRARTDRRPSRPLRSAPPPTRRARHPASSPKRLRPRSGPVRVRNTPDSQPALRALVRTTLCGNRHAYQECTRFGISAGLSETHLGRAV